MDSIFQRRFLPWVAICAALLLNEGLLSAQDANPAKSSNQASLQQTAKVSADENANKVQQQDQKAAAEKKDLKVKQQKKDVKKVQSSNPDLTKKAGARPPSINRPSGAGMPKGTGKPAGVIRPGRR